MFKCKECGQEYKEKPDYCDCGNDTFDEIVTAQKEEKEVVKKEESIQESILKNNLPSIIFFAFCIILSFIILFFIGNPKETAPVKKENNETKVVQNLPDIDKLWNDAKPKQKVEAPKIESKKEEIIQPEKKIAKVELKKDTSAIKNIPVIKNTPKKTQTAVQQPQKQSSKAQQKQTQTVQKQTQTVQKTTQTVSKTTPQPVKQTTAQPAKQSTTQPKTTSQQTVSQQTTTQQTTPKTTASQQTSQQTSTSSNVQVPKTTGQVTQTTNLEELKQYKKALRNKIASNINFLNVVGDGKCALSFSVSSSGALLNRKFVSQSQNTSLNDAVYSAMTKVSSFKTPPTAYRGETMKLTVQISGGNFSVSLE